MTTPGASTIDGRILAVSQTILGDELTTAVAVGTTALPVDDAIDFGEGAGTVRIGGVGGEILAYSVAGDQDDGTGLVTLAAPTTAAHAAGDRVDLWDAANGVPFVTWRALLDPVSDLEVADPIDAVVSHALIPLLPEGIRDPGEGEAVTATRAPSGWMLTDVRGKSPVIDGATIAPATIPQAALSFTTGTTTTTIAATAPASANTGDLWFDASNGNKMNEWSGGGWVPRQWGSSSLAAGVAVKTSLGTTAPDAPGDGDLWLAVDGNGGFQMQRYSATSGTWVALQWNTNAIAANAITAGQILAGSLDAISITSVSLTTATMSGHVIGSQISGSDFLADNDNGRVLVYQQAATVVPLTGQLGTWTVPAGVTSVKVEAWGGGGGGGGGATKTGTNAATVAGGGGGGGEYARETLTVTPGQVFSYNVGVGGISGNAGGSGSTSSASGGAGGIGSTTTFGPLSTPLVIARGGKGGGGAIIDVIPSNGAGGAGGTGSVASVHFDGGAGYPQGGGGSSAGTSARGNSATSSTGATAPTGGGKGGSLNFPGIAPGGGGGGGPSAANGGWPGGAGQLQVTYFATTLVATVAAQPGTDTLTGTAYPAGIKVQRADLVETPAPTGSITMFAGPTAPAGYLFCQGQTVPRSGTGGYPALFAVIGTAYGAGDGSTTFTLPDLRVRFPLGAGSRPAGAAGAATTVAVGATGGNDAHTHSTPAHAHPLGVSGAARIMASGTAVIVDTGNNALGVTPNFSATATGFARTSGGTASAASAALQGATEQGGSGTSGIPSNGYQPYTTVNYMIKT